MPQQHPADDLVWWGDKDGANRKAQLRSAWDSIKEAGLEDNLKLLLQAAVSITEAEIAYDNTDFSGD